MNATTRLNSANNFANCNNHIESNFGSGKSSSNNNIYKRIPAVTTTTKTKTTHSYSDNNTNNNLPLQQTASNGIAAGQQQQQQQQQRLCSPAPAETATSRECSSVAYSTLTTMRLVGAKESGATVADAEEARTKLMPATAIKIISVNNSKSNNNNTKAHKNVSSNNKNSLNNNNNNLDNNINKSTTKSTGTTGAKLDSSMLINARNQLSTITTTTSERRQQQEQMGQQQTEHMLSITRDLNQINLKSSLYAEQQAYNANNNNNKHNCRGNNQQEQQQQNSLSTNVSSDNNNGSSNNKHSSAGNNNRQKQQQQIINCKNNNSSKDCDQAIDKNKNSKNTHTPAHNNRRIMKNYETNNNNNSKGTNEPHPQQQQLITLTIAKAVQTETNALVSEKISTTTKVNTTTTTTTPTPTPTIERAKAKSTKLTLRKSFSTPASFKIADVAAAMSQSGGSMMIAYNNNNNSRASESYSKSVSKALPKSELLSGKKSDSDGGGDVVVGGGGHVRGAATCTMQPATQSAVASPKVNFAPSPAIITNATQRANASIESITTVAKTTATTKTSTTTTISASPQLATVDVATRSQTAAHASQQDPAQVRQLQQQQQLRQQQYQQSSTKSVKAKDNDNQVICGNKSVLDDGNVVVVADTTTTSSPLPLSPVSFDLDLRFGCAHYKRRAMFVTPCCNKFYKCRFCHDENESHHFDRKTLTELICSECNTRQKVQEQCEACGTRFGKYTCLICNLFDDTDKKQYHCNGCGICRIGGAENFFHCKVCDMCLPIRLKIDGHRCVENISRSHCPVCLGDIHTSRIPCHIPDCGHLLHKTCFDQLLNSGHYTCPICQTSLIDMTALWEYLDAQAVSLPVPKKYENQRIHIFCNDCHKTSKTKFNFIGLKCMQCGAYNTTQDVKRRMSLVTDEPSSA